MLCTIHSPTSRGVKRRPWDRAASVKNNTIPFYFIGRGFHMENQLQVSKDGSVTELAVRPATLAADLVSGGQGMWTSLDKTKAADQAIMIKCLGTADKRSDDVINQILNVRHILAHNVEMQNSQTGEVMQSVRIVLVTTDGETIGTVSKGIYSSLQSITSIVGVPPWENGIRLRIKPQTTRNGFRTLVLEFLGLGAGDADEKKGGKK